MPRARVMAANWKMHKTPAEAAAYIAALAAAPLPPAVTVVVAPPFPCLPAAAAARGASPIALAGQDLHWAAEGAYTGEVSAAMLLACGCAYVLIGHSERRQMFGETDATVRRKTAAALAAGLTPIVCVGESRAQRQAGETEAVLARQCERALAGLPGLAPGKLLLAYEPVWAIGTGDTATPELAQAAQHHLRACLRQAAGEAVALATPILYGGSVKLDNAAALLACPDIDGALVGGASLDPGVFAQLLQRAV